MAQSGNEARMAETMSAILSSVKYGSSPPWSTKVRKPSSYPAWQQARICALSRR